MWRALERAFGGGCCPRCPGASPKRSMPAPGLSPRPWASLATAGLNQRGWARAVVVEQLRQTSAGWVSGSRATPQDGHPRSSSSWLRAAVSTGPRPRPWMGLPACLAVAEIRSATSSVTPSSPISTRCGADIPPDGRSTPDEGATPSTRLHVDRLAERHQSLQPLPERSMKVS